MASYQTLDIAVKIGGNFGALDRLANKLDEVDRKAKQVRNIPINVDVDGDSEAVGRLSGVQTAAEAADDDVDIDVATSGGMDARNRLSSILSDLGDLQGRTVELASQLDFDESYVNDSLDSLRENLRGKNVEDLGDADIRQYQQQLATAEDRFRRIGTELYVDTSEMETDVRELRSRLQTAVTGDESRTINRGGEERELDIVNAERTFDDLNEQLESAETEVEIENVSDLPSSSAEDISRTVQTRYTERGKLPSIEDTRRVVEQNITDIDDTVLDDVSQEIQREFEREEPSSVDDLTRRVRTVFNDYDVPHVGDERRTVHTDFEDTDVPSTFEDLRASIDDADIENAIEQTRRLQQQFSELDRTSRLSETDDTGMDERRSSLPALEQRMDTFGQTLERRVSTETEVDVDDDVLRDQLTNLEDEVYEIDPTVDVEPRVDVDTSQIDTDVFSQKLHSLGQNLSDERQFYTEMGVDVEGTYEDLGNLHRQFTAEVDDGDLDTSRLKEYRGAMADLQQRLHSVGEVSSDISGVEGDIGRLGEDVQDFRVGDTDLRQPLERGSFRNRIDTARDELSSIQQDVIQSLDPDADFSGDEIDTEVELEDNAVLQRITAMRAALTALDDTVVDIDTDVDRAELAQRLQSFQTVADREMELFGTNRESLTDFDPFETTVSEHSGSIGDDDDLIGDLSSTLQQSFDAEGSGFAPLEHEDISRSWGDRARSTATNIFGPRNYARMRGEGAFSPEDFIGRGFNVEDLVASDTDLTAEDIFEFDDREITDVFESERSFRAYLNPETDVDLGDAMREDRSFADLGGDRRGITGRLSELGDVDMSTFYDAMAKTVPLLGTFVMSLPSAVGGLLAVGGAGVAAAASLAAIGALSIGGLALTLGDGNLQQGLQQIRTELIQDARSAFAPLAQQFSGLGQDALDGVGRFFDRLAAQGQVLTELEDEARSFGEWVYNNAPAAIDDIVALAEAFSPLFAQGAEWATSTDIIGGFVDVAQDTVPPLLMILDAFLTMLPVILEFSTGMLQASAMVFQFWQAVWSLIDALGPMAQGLGLVIGVGLSLYTTLTLLNWAFGALSTVVGTSAVGTLWSYAMAASIATLQSSALSSVITYLGSTSLVSAISGFLSAIPVLGSYITASTAATVATYGLAAAIAATGVGALLVGVGLLSSQFLSTSGSIQEATKSLKDFESMRSSMGGDGINNPYGPLEHGDMTSIDPNAPTQSGVQGDGSGQQNVTVNNDNSTEINVGENSSSDPQSLQKEISHQQFRDRENSSKPY